jgi:hypothetical protein
MGYAHAQVVDYICEMEGRSSVGAHDDEIVYNLRVEGDTTSYNVVDDDRPTIGRPKSNYWLSSVLRELLSGGIRERAAAVVVP